METSVPVADHYKAPTDDIYIVYGGGDHFTLLFKSGNERTWFAYNALPPSNCLIGLELLGDSVTAPPPVAASRKKQSQCRLVLGAVESIVQSHPEYKNPKQGKWKLWRFELCLVNKDMVADDLATPARPEGREPSPKFELGAQQAEGDSWRKVKCYSKRFSTMCFGGPRKVEVPPPCCKFCGTGLSEAGWTVYKEFESLPKGLQKRIDRDESKLLSTLRTRWSDLDVLLESGVVGDVDPKGKVPVV